MTPKGHRQLRWAHLLWVVPFMVTSWPAVAPAQTGGERILIVAKNAIYGGATGLLLGGVLTLVVHAEDRDDVVRWGVVAGTFVGFGYGVYEARGQKDEFSERVQARANARLQARRVSRNETGIASVRTAATPRGSIPACRASAIRPLDSLRYRRSEERPEPATGGATGRSS